MKKELSPLKDTTIIDDECQKVNDFYLIEKKNNNNNISNTNLTYLNSIIIDEKQQEDKDSCHNRCSYRFLETVCQTSVSQKKIQKRQSKKSHKKKQCRFRYLSAPNQTRDNQQIVHFNNIIVISKIINKTTNEIKEANSLNSNSQVQGVDLSFQSISIAQSNQQIINLSQEQEESEKIKKRTSNASSKKSEKISKKKVKEQKMENEEYFELNQQYKKIKDQNTLKNIKKAFIKHINSELSTQLKEMYVQQMGGNLQFGQIKKKINFKLKTQKTTNKCIKLMCKSNSVSPIFQHFLENVNEFWLSKSNIQQKDNCRANCSFLLVLINNTKYIDVIEHYHTKV